MSIDECFAPKYDAEFFKLMRDSVAGQRVIKAAGEAYMLRRAAMIGREYDEEYKAFIHMADYLPVVRRTRSGLIGRAFTKSPVYEGDYDADDLEKSGLSIERFLRWVLSEIMTVKYCGVLADADDDGSPLLVKYIAEDILDWHFERGKLVYLSLRENSTTVTGGVRTTVQGVRVWELDDSGDAFSVLHTRDEGNKDWTEYRRAYPRATTGNLKFIPFRFIGDVNSNDSVLGPLAELSLAYYDTSAQHNWALSKVASPTFVIKWGANVTAEDAQAFLGMSGTENGIKIGSGHALQLKDADASFLEVSGSGLVLVERRLDGLKSQMIAAGARALADSNNTQIAAETARIHNSGESSILGEIVGAAETDFNAVLEMLDEISNESIGTVKLSRDFFSEGVTAQDLVSLVAGWQGGAWPQEVVFEALRRGDWSDKTDEELQDAILEQ